MSGLKINDIVYNKRYNTIGIVLDDFNDGEIRTDADGVVYVSDLKLIKTKEEFNKFVKIINPKIAPSTLKLINDNVNFK